MRISNEWCDLLDSLKRGPRASPKWIPQYERAMAVLTSDESADAPRTRGMLMALLVQMLADVEELQKQTAETDARLESVLETRCTVQARPERPRSPPRYHERTPRATPRPPSQPPSSSSPRSPRVAVPAGMKRSRTSPRRLQRSERRLDLHS